MSSKESPGFWSSGPSDAEIQASLAMTGPCCDDLAFAHLLMPTARGKGNVTSTPMMLSPAGPPV
eukprot:15600747-Heterocapsa_arctica.AAC.1